MGFWTLVVVGSSPAAKRTGKLSIAEGMQERALSKRSDRTTDIRRISVVQSRWDPCCELRERIWYELAPDLGRSLNNITRLEKHLRQAKYWHVLELRRHDSFLCRPLLSSGSDASSRHLFAPLYDAAISTLNPEKAAIFEPSQNMIRPLERYCTVIIVL
jgi:hypothetical protein